MSSATIPKAMRTALYRSRKRANRPRGTRFVVATVNPRETFFGKVTRRAFRQFIDRRKHD